MIIFLIFIIYSRYSSIYNTFLINENTNGSLSTKIINIKNLYDKKYQIIDKYKVNYIIINRINNNYNNVLRKINKENENIKNLNKKYEKYIQNIEDINSLCILRSDYKREYNDITKNGYNYLYDIEINNNMLLENIYNNIPNRYYYTDITNIFDLYDRYVNYTNKSNIKKNKYDCNIHIKWENDIPNIKCCEIK